MEEIRKCIEEISKASKCGKLVFFVGAGLSRLSEYPQWWELVNKYYVELYGRAKEGEFSANEYLRIPQIYYDVKEEDAYDKVLEDVFSVDKATNPIHDKILAMNPTHIITTNYDNLIDKACWQRGKYFSIISNDEDIAKATSSRYLLKVHGDFRRGYKGKYVVLKESDYMNYEQNYPLISNLMKTIMSTSTIVFVGYGLGDYNINLLLNWVKQLQKDGYKKPYFIRTEHDPIEENTRIYYEKKGLQIIDATSLVRTNKEQYMERYSAALDILIETKQNELLSESVEVINFIHQKVSPLFPLGSVRKTDLKHVFEFDYDFKVNGTVVKTKNKGFGYMEHYFELKNKGIDNLPEGTKQQFNEITLFFEKNNIICMMKDAANKIVKNSLEIQNLAYHNNYEKMEEFISVATSDLVYNYQKAFYLACLGRWEEAYNLYSELILESIDESNWWIHYLSQINRYRLYQSITQIDEYLGSVGILLYGGRYKPFPDEFLKHIGLEMKHYNIDDVFDSMPYEFKEKYKILEFLSDAEYLYDDTVKLFSLTNKIRSEISKGTYSLGLTTDAEVYLRLCDNLRFLYENHLWLVNFGEFKQYIRNSLTLQFEKAEYEQTRDIDEFGLVIGTGRKRFYIDYNDFVNVTKSFSIDDIEYIESSCKIERFEFRDMEDIEKYLIRIADEIIRCFSKDGMNIVFYNQIISEAKVAIYFARYIKLSEEGIAKILKALLFYFPELDSNAGKRYLWTERLILGSGLSNSTIGIIEEFLIMQAEMHKDSNYTEYSSNNLFSRDFANLIHHFDKKYISKNLSTYTMKLSEDMKNQVDFMYRLSRILSCEAQSHLLQLKKIKGINDLIDSLLNGTVTRISDYTDIIIDFMDSRMAKILADRNSGITELYSGNYAVKFGIYYFLGELTDSRMKNYLNIDDEYDLFVGPESYDYEKLNLSWLKHYSDEVLQKMAENKYMRPHIINALKERIKNTKDKKYFEIFMEHFL